MLFARYIGGDRLNFTSGKFYLLSNQLRNLRDESGGWLVDDRGQRQRIQYADVDFTILHIGYGIWLGTGPKIFEHKLGEVVRVVGADDGMVELGDKRFFKASYLAWWDSRFVHPGAWVQDTLTHGWTKIVTVDDTGWIATEGLSERQEPLFYRVAVSDGSPTILRPLVRSVSPVEASGVEQGMTYPLLRGWPGEGMLQIEVKGHPVWLSSERFFSDFV